MAQVALDYRQGDTGLDEPRGVAMPEVVGSGRFVRPLSLALVKAGTQPLVWKFCARTGSLGAPRHPLPELVNTHSSVRSSLARVSAAKSIVRMLRWVLGAPAGQRSVRIDTRSG